MRAYGVKIDKQLLTTVGLGLLAFIVFRRDIAGIIGGSVQSVAEGAGEIAGSIVVGAGTGVVLGVARSVGIPDTEADKCQAALDAGEMWTASFYCPAGTFLQSAWGEIFDTSTGETIGQTEGTGQAEIIRIDPAPATEFDYGGGNISDYPAA